MTRVYRILRRRFAKAPFDGEGAFQFGGRWSSPGTRLAYTSEHESLAMIEYFVHVSPEDAPHDLVIVTADVPETVPRIQLSTKSLPRNWRENPAPAPLARFGDEFLRNQTAAILMVPSALAPSEANWLINPAHPDFSKLRIQPIQRFEYDPRMGKRE